MNIVVINETYYDNRNRLMP